MAKLSDLGMGNRSYTKPETLYQNRTVFTMMNAIIRKGGKFGTSVEFTIYPADGDEALIFSLKHNEVRQKFVDWFQSGGEPVENLKLDYAQTKNGQTAWNFVEADSPDQAYDDLPF